MTQKRRFYDKKRYFLTLKKRVFRQEKSVLNRRRVFLGSFQRYLSLVPSLPITRSAVTLPPIDDGGKGRR